MTAPSTGPMSTRGSGHRGDGGLDSLKSMTESKSSRTVVRSGSAKSSAASDEVTVSRSDDSVQSGATRQHRTRRDRKDIRDLLIAAAMVEFGTRGYEGASTRSIAERANAHQPQINYHFANKFELWKATVERLFELLETAMVGLDEIKDPGDHFAEWIRRLVDFAAENPALNQIIVQESSSRNERTEWLVENYIRPRFAERRRAWRRLRAAGIAAPLDENLVHYVVIGAVTLPFVNSAEATMLFGGRPDTPRLVRRHADGLVRTLLPGLGH